MNSIKWMAIVGFAFCVCVVLPVSADGSTQQIIHLRQTYSSGKIYSHDRQLWESYTYDINPAARKVYVLVRMENSIPTILSQNWMAMLFATGQTTHSRISIPGARVAIRHPARRGYMWTGFISL